MDESVVFGGYALGEEMELMYLQQQQIQQAYETFALAKVNPLDYDLSFFVEQVGLEYKSTWRGVKKE